MLWSEEFQIGSRVSIPLLKVYLIRRGIREILPFTMKTFFKENPQNTKTFILVKFEICAPAHDP